jgi:hypothetical protein
MSTQTGKTDAGQRRDRPWWAFLVSSALGLGSAALCACFVITVGILFLMWPMSAWFGLLLFGIKDRASVEIFSGFMGLLLCAPAPYAGVIPGRFVLRAAPPRISGGRRIGLFVSLAVVGASALLPTLYFAKEMQVDLAYKLLFCLSTGLVLVGLYVLVGSRYRRTRELLGKRYVLFLRRFSTFADRAVMSVIMRASPPGVPVVVLTPTSSRRGDWDPYMVCVAGLKLRHPIRSTQELGAGVATTPGWVCSDAVCLAAALVVLGIGDPDRFVGGTRSGVRPRTVAWRVSRGHSSGAADTAALRVRVLLRAPRD